MDQLHMQYLTSQLDLKSRLEFTHTKKNSNSLHLTVSYKTAHLPICIHVFYTSKNVLNLAILTEFSWKVLVSRWWSLLKEMSRYWRAGISPNTCFSFLSVETKGHIFVTHFWLTFNFWYMIRVIKNSRIILGIVY